MNAVVYGVLALCSLEGRLLESGQVIVVSTTIELRSALVEAKPGTTIEVAPGDYEGGLSIHGLKGEPDRPIIVRAADPMRPPTIRGGGSAIHLAQPAYVEIRDLVIEGASGNGLNIDDGGNVESPAHQIRLIGLTIRDIGPVGNRDGIKLSGVDDFVVTDCKIERWGSNGSGIDMVGCHQGVIKRCTFKGEGRGDHGVQAKGGSDEIVVRRCLFQEAGSRALNLGGSTGRPYFRPPNPGSEARDLRVEDCTVIGSRAGVAFVGVDGATVRHNLFVLPGRYAIRILQESQAPEFIPSCNGRFKDNVIVFRSDAMVLPINIGPGTASETYSLSRNVWYCVDKPDHSQPRLAIPEVEGRYGVDPRIQTDGAGSFALPLDSPARPAGPRPED